MFSLQKFFGKDPRFFELFEQGAKEAYKAAAALNMILGESSSPADIQSLREARRNSKELNEEIHTLMIKTFVTSLDREDIAALSTALYKILKPIEKFVERYQIASSFIKGTAFKGQAESIVEAVFKVSEMVKLIKSSGNLEKARRLNSALQQAEADADELELNLLKALYSDKSIDAKEMFLIKDLYDLLEKCVDRCRDVGNVIMHIVLKNS